jgi:hypothetical protein
VTLAVANRVHLGQQRVEIGASKDPLTVNYRAVARTPPKLSFKTKHFSTDEVFGTCGKHSLLSNKQ